MTGTALFATNLVKFFLVLRVLWHIILVALVLIVKKVLIRHGFVYHVQ